MPLGFHHSSKDMTFVDDGLHSIVMPTQLVPGKRYRVFFVLQNTSGLDHDDVQIMVRHGLAEDTVSLDGDLIQPRAVTVPASLNGYPGLAAVEFVFTVPNASEGVIVATILPDGTSMTQRWSARSTQSVVQFPQRSSVALRVAQEC